MAFQAAQSCLTSARREWRNRDEVELVRDVSCLHFQLSINWGRDLIDAKRLALPGIGWLCKDDISLLQTFRMDAVCRTDQLQFVASVSFFRHRTGLCICQFSDPLWSKVISLESYKHGITGCPSPQSVHQRGMTSTVRIPPVHAICVFPPAILGNHPKGWSHCKNRRHYRHYVSHS